MLNRVISAAVTLILLGTAAYSAVSKHFNPKGKSASKFTIEKQEDLRKSLPFEDKRDFGEQKRGFIAAPSYKQIKKDDGKIVWDMGVFEFLPQGKDFDSTENIVHSVHNIYTLRGALVRDPLGWANHINVALYKFGQEAEILISSHNWPRWGNERVQEVIRAQRDAYMNLNNQVLHYANQGVTINEIHNVYKVPNSLRKQWVVRQYHGSEFHNSRAVINRYLGYWDGNPATLAPLSPRDSAPLYVEMMGGRICLPTYSSNWATSMRAQACATCTLPQHKSCARGSRRADHSRLLVPTWSGL